MNGNFLVTLKMLGSALKSKKVVKKTAKPKKDPKKETPKFTEAEITDLKLAFNLLDKNSDGHMSVSELSSMLQEMGIEMNLEFIDILVKEASGGNLCLDETEFMNWVYKIQTIREDQAKKSGEEGTSSSKELDEEEEVKNDFRAAFWVFDKDGNGYISQDELRSAMEIMDESITEEQLNEIFKMADTDRDGKICYEDFMKILM